MKTLSNIFCALGIILVAIGGLIDRETAAAWVEDLIGKAEK